MKTLSIVLLIAIIGITIFNFCSDTQSVDLNMVTKTIQAAAVDTVGEMFSIALAPISNKCITAIGADSFMFDPGAFEYLSDSTKKYGLFFVETVTFFAPNRIAFGFANQTNGAQVCNWNGSKEIFRLYFKVREGANENVKDFFCNAVQIENNGAIVPYKKESAKLSVIFRSMQLFWLNWIVKSV
jgi:hypothetical protein